MMFRSIKSGVTYPTKQLCQRVLSVNKTFFLTQKNTQKLSTYVFKPPKWRNYINYITTHGMTNQSQQHQSPPKLCSELTKDQIDSATIPVNLKQQKITHVKDLFDFATRLFNEGEPGLCNIKDGKPYEPYKKGYPPVPPSLLFLFRGHHYPARDLVPSAHRFKEEPGNHYSLENTQVPAFKLKNPEFKQNRHFGMCETLAIMQHYGYPTRFLDWSSSIMSAAYFACQPDKRHDHEDGIIWVLNPFKLNLAATLSKKVIGIALSDSFDAEIRSLQAITDCYYDLKEHSNLLLHSTQRPDIFTDNDFTDFIQRCMHDKEVMERMRYSIAVDLGFPNDRIAAQKGLFTIAAGKQYFNRAEISAEHKEATYSSPLSLFNQAQEIQKKNQYSHPFLKCVIVDKACKNTIRHDLDVILGINESSMMVDLDSHGKTTRALYQFKRKS